MTIMSDEDRGKEDAKEDSEMAPEGYLDFETYTRLVEENPSILRWFTIDLHRVEHWAKNLKK